MIDLVTKKTPKPDPAPKPVAKSFQFPVRIDDPSLVEALDRYAKSLRRSRNLTVILILEEILRAKGFWPPPS